MSAPLTPSELARKIALAAPDFIVRPNLDRNAVVFADISYAAFIEPHLSELAARAEQAEARVQEVEAELAAAQKEILDEIEGAARQGCASNTVERDWKGQVAGTVVTTSGAISTYAEQLRRLSAAGRFHIVSEFGRMVVGYWPENKPSDAAIDAARANPKSP